MTPSDVIAEASVEDLQRRIALLNGLCSRILDVVVRGRKSALGHFLPSVHPELYNRWRKELDELSK